MLAKEFEMAGKKYGNGMVSSYNGAYALFNPDSKYKTLDCVIGHQDYNTKSKTVSFIVDGRAVKKVELEAECMPQTVSIPLNYGLQLKIITSDTYAYENTIGIANMTVK